MFNRRLKSNLIVLTLVITFLWLFKVTILSADTRFQANGDSAEACYKEDINKDGNINILDITALVILGFSEPGNPVADYNGNGFFSIADAVALLINISTGNLTPLEIFSLSGRVVENGQGLEDVDVRVQSPDVFAKATTDSLGMYRVENLPCGSYVLWCKKSEYYYTFNPDPAMVIISGESVIVPDIEGTLAAYTLSGRVLEDSIGLPDVTINVMGVGVDTAVVTDSVGMYRVEGLLDANYAVVPVKENYTFNPISVAVSVWGDSVVVPDINATYVGTSPPELYTIGGMVYCTVQPLANVQVVLMGDMDATTITDANGLYTFAVPNGNYIVSGIPNPTYQNFNPPSHEVTVAGQNILNLNFFAWGAGGEGLTEVTTTSSSLSAAEKPKADGYDVRLSATHIELKFPDGSVISAPMDFNGKSLDKLSATEGMAQEMLDMTYEQMGLKKSADLPKAFSLSQNHPNPFNPSTTINYTVPEGAGEYRVRLSVYSLRGQLVKILVDATQLEGAYSVNWDGTAKNGRRVSSGVYFYRLVAGDYVSTRKMVILK